MMIQPLPIAGKLPIKLRLLGNYQQIIIIEVPAYLTFSSSYTVCECPLSLPLCLETTPLELGRVGVSWTGTVA